MSAAWRLLLVWLLVSASYEPARAQAAADPPRGELRIVVFGDFNGPYGALAYGPAVARVVRTIGEVWRPDLVLAPGDLVAGQSHALPDGHFERMWEAFDEAVGAPLRAALVPLAPAIGNHDGSSERAPGGGYAFARERDAAAAYWRRALRDTSLEMVDPQAFPFTYAFRHGGAFVAVIDASSAFVDDATREWLERVLTDERATSAATRIVMGHLPLFGVTERKNRPGEVVTDGAALARLLEDLDVDTYVSGHHAAYYPGRRGSLELLFAGGIGGHALIGSAAPGRSAVTVMDVWFSPLRVRYTSFDPGDMTRIDGDALPERIEGLGGAVERSNRGTP